MLKLKQMLKRLPILQDIITERDMLFQDVVRLKQQMNDRSGEVRNLIDRYCLGQGLEIGPGKNPYCDRSNTKFLEKFPSETEGNIEIDMVADAFDIPECQDAFDFLVSAHVLEHLPNTLQALFEWKRVLRNDGVLFLVLPHANRTFDRQRQLTTIQHHIEDYEKGVGYEDQTHRADWGITVFTTRGEHREEDWKNAWIEDPNPEMPGNSLNWDGVVRSGKVHYHVWTQNEMVDLLRYVGFKILYVTDKLDSRTDSFIVVGKNVKE